MPTSKRTTRRLLLFWATCNIVFVVALYYHPVVVQYFVETPENSLSQSAQLPVEPVQALFKTAAIMSAKTEPTQIEAMQIKPPEPISQPPGEPINCLYLHIPKTGGTSFTKQLIGMERDSPRVNRHRMFTYTSIRYQKHFDWSVVDHMKAKHDYQVVTLLRNPVDRAISHFHFIKSQPWVSREFLKMNLEQFVRDPQALMDYRGVWQDGQVYPNSFLFLKLDHNSLGWREFFDGNSCGTIMGR